jgi:mono/diheme cytochrome c family protein
MKVLRLVGLIAGGLVVLVVVALGIFMSAFPKVAPPLDVKVEITPERIERGEYLARHVSQCLTCHSNRDFRYFSGPVVAGSEGQGGDLFGREQGLPGNVYAQNITPFGLEHWTDGEIIRAITGGISIEGTALFPIMPYTEYAHLAQEDAYSLVAYLRSMPFKEGLTPDRELDFPLNLIVRMIPQPAELQPEPDRSDSVAYGKYLSRIAGCHFCHTPEESGQKIVGMEFAGGMEFFIPDGIVRAMNITPDRETGIGTWDRTAFINLFKSYTPEAVAKKTVERGEFNTDMPWSMYSGMSEEDLGALFAYLKMVPPVKNRVVRYEVRLSKE